VNILFLCTANIQRSKTAEELFRAANNIHQSLKEVFSNPENVYGFMNMQNSNPYFNGKNYFIDHSYGEL
tara:strand:- start:5671 stop:5877 length:207 start_codon:yes stop_codon:yes gene_type:complete